MLKILLVLMVLGESGSPTPKDFKFSPEFAEIVLQRKHSFFWSALSVDRYGKFMSIFPKGCDVTQSNMQKLVDVGVLDWEHPIDSLKVPFTGMLTYKQGVVHYKNGFIHRDSEPAIILKNGTQEWLQYGLRHRTDGPAVIRSDAKFWYKNGVLYREDGPVIIYNSGTEYWIQEGRLRKKA